MSAFRGVVGAIPYHLISAAGTNATSVKASAGILYGLAAGNINASPRYLKLYDSATAPSVGTSVPVQTYIIPGNTAGAGSNYTFTYGKAFVNGIAFAITGGIADSDTTAINANEVVVDLDYK